MKRPKLTSFMLMASILSAIPCWGQTDKNEWRLAVDILKDKDTSKDKEWAANLLIESQNYEKDAYVQNVLGIAFLHGLGVKADTTRAISYFKESGSMGYSQAYHNLGMYYKYATGGKQDFEKAYNAFKNGADAGNPNNCYNCGFMLYKGLGCQQNYEAAIDQFLRAADHNHASAMFMLGLCYRNGFGVEADTTIANIYLRNAAELGSIDAMEEMQKEYPENSSKILEAYVDDIIDVPSEMPTIVPYMQKQDISGTYNGVLATYDWSGMHLQSETPLSISMEVNKDSLYGLWIQGTDSIMFSARIESDGTIRFNNTTADLYDRYSNSTLSKYLFEHVNLNYASDIITGELRLYSLSEMEPERPMSVSLRKKEEDAADEKYTKLFAYSSPSSNQISLKFELEEAVSAVSVSFYSRTGMNVANYKYGGLNAGESILTVSPDIPDGYYTITVVAGNKLLSTIIVK